MLLRALVVLLVILNFGVAVWWAARGDAGDAHALVANGPGTLRLADEPPDVADPVETVSPPTALGGPPAAEPDARPVADVATAPPRAAVPPQCLALGPFADAAVRDAARARLNGHALRTAARDVGETPRGWRVWMTPRTDRADADAVVARLLEAGFNDYYIIADGAEAHGIALGRFGSEAPAQGRAAALRAAGFEAEAQPLGSLLVRYWIDTMLADGASAETLRARTGAARAESRDCDVTWDAG